MDSAIFYRSSDVTNVNSSQLAVRRAANSVVYVAQ